MLLISPRQDVQSEIVFLLYNINILSSIHYLALIKKCQTSSLDSVITELTSEDCTYISGQSNIILVLFDLFNKRYLSDSTKTRVT